MVPVSPAPASQSVLPYAKQVTANSVWVLLDKWSIIGKLGPVIYEKSSYELRVEDYLANVEIKIKKECTKVTGTKAKLKTGDTLELNQIFYGLLLPSGNDAALVLADFFGGLLAKKK